MKKDDKYWRENLDEEQYRVARENGTEAPFSGKYVDWHEDGIFRCVGCGSALFGSETKYDSGSGWPSFTDPMAKDAVVLVEDDLHGMHRTEVRCAKCDAHLGHVFPDGPKGDGQSGNRYCINSCVLDFDEN